MEEFDLYDDLISEKKSLDQAEEQQPEVDKLRKELKQSNEKLRTLRNKNFELKQKCDQLETNISSLIKTSRSEINRKNEIIASLRRELDQISFRRILKQRQGSSSEIRELTERLTDVLKNDSPSSKLSISDGVTNGVKPKNKSIKVTHFNTEDVYTIKLGNTSFTNVFSGRKEMPSLGFSNNDRNEVLTVQQTIPDTLVQEPKLNDNGEMRDVPAVPSQTSEKKTPMKKAKSDEKCNERTSSNMKNRDQNRNNRDHYHSRSSRRSDRDSGETKRPSRRSSSRSHRGEKKSSERHSYKSSSSTKEMSKSNTESKRDKPDSSKDKYVKKSSKSPKKSITSSSSSTNDIQSSRIATGKKNSQTSLELTEMDILNTNQDTNDIDSLLEEKKRLLAKLEKEQRALLSEGGDEIIVKIDQNKKKICSQNEAASKGSDREEGECEDEDEIIIDKMDDQKKCQSKNQSVETTACQQGSERDILDTTPNKNEDSIDGIISTNDFLGNWPARSFTQYKTPPSKNNRNRTDSETSSHVDFSSAAGS